MVTHSCHCVNAVIISSYWNDGRFKYYDARFFLLALFQACTSSTLSLLGSHASHCVGKAGEVTAADRLLGPGIELRQRSVRSNTPSALGDSAARAGEVAFLLF